MISKTIGIRREDKNIWEKRVPLVPKDVEFLFHHKGVRTILQPSNIRIIPDTEYLNAGASIQEELTGANTVFAVKEIPLNFIQKGHIYIFFSHTIKGQVANMPMLEKLMELKCNLIDYERIVDETDRRLIFFGRHAGLAGMIETLHSWGQKLKLQGYSTVFDTLKQAYQYDSVEEAKRHIFQIGQEIKNSGFPKDLSPVIIGFAGYGNVSQGAQEILDIFPCKEILPDELPDIYDNLISDHFTFYKVVFYEKHLVKSKQGDFNLQQYYDYPQKYESQFNKYLPYLNILVNCIYWTEEYPRLITKKYLQSLSDHTLIVIGDISCDIEGSIEITTKATEPDSPTYTYYPNSDSTKDGNQPDGVTVMSVDNLPCEFPRESSEAFSSVLSQFVEDIVTTDFQAEFEKLDLPYPVKKALILHNGSFTPEYQYMHKFISRESL